MSESVEIGHLGRQDQESIILLLMIFSSSVNLHFCGHMEIANAPFSKICDLCHYDPKQRYSHNIYIFVAIFIIDRSVSIKGKNVIK